MMNQNSPQAAFPEAEKGNINLYIDGAQCHSHNSKHPETHYTEICNKHSLTTLDVKKKKSISKKKNIKFEMQCREFWERPFLFFSKRQPPALSRETNTDVTKTAIHSTGQ